MYVLGYERVCTESTLNTIGVRTKIASFLVIPPHKSVLSVFYPPSGSTAILSSLTWNNEFNQVALSQRRKEPASGSLDRGDVTAIKLYSVFAISEAFLRETNCSIGAFIKNPSTPKLDLITGHKDKPTCSESVIDLINVLHFH
jgi:hypothetical protein